MAQNTSGNLPDRTPGEYSQTDPKPIVNYTIGMIITFVILILLAVFVIGIYNSTSQNPRGGEAGQSEQRANP